jgi:hypothetical protein
VISYNSALLAPDRTLLPSDYESDLQLENWRANILLTLFRPVTILAIVVVLDIMLDVVEDVH